MHRLCQAIRLSTVAFLVCFTSALSAQTITANVAGTVLDRSGAVIPGAVVRATNVDTNVATSTTSNKDGIYNLRFLQVGRYVILVEAPGFAPRTFGPLTLEANQDAKVDAPLSVAGEAKTVSVEASVAPLLNTENAQLGVTLDTAAMEPLVGEQFVQLTVFTPGAVNTNPSALTANGQIALSTGTNNGVSVNGNRVTTNNYLLDGIEVNDTLNNTVGYNVSPEALGQIQLTSSNANAEYGNVNGGDVIMLLKSGTNKFHGEAYYFLSDYILDANTWANKNFPTSAGFISKASYTQPIFGGTIGGPILHNRLFFFADYEGGRYHTAGTGLASVLTAKMRTGDFSELLDPNIMGTGKTIQLYDASSTAFAPYLNNRIPIVSPVAQYLFAHPEAYPLPNHAVGSIGSPAANNYAAPSKSRQYNNQFDVKVDARISQRDSLMARWLQSDNGTTSTPVLPTSFPTAPVTPVKGIALNEIHTFSPSIVNEFRAGYTRIRPEAGLPIDSTGLFGAKGNALVGIGASNQGIIGFASNSVTPAGTSGLSTSNGSEYSAIGSSYGGMTYVDNSFTYGDNFSWLKDRHTFKLGVQFIRYQSNCFSPGNDGVLGTLNYTGLGTSNPVTGTAGYSIADFVLNRVAYAGQGVFSGPQGLRQWRDAYFIQDDWRLTATLTVNLGFRYEYDQPMYEVNNKYTSVDFNTKQIVHAGSPAANALGGRALVFPYYGDVQPRVGFAWSSTPRLVVRGGYGVQTFMEATGETRRMTINPPNNADNYSVGTVPSKTTPAQYFTIQTAFSSPNGVPPVSLNAWDSHIRPALINEYNLTLEYQVNNTASLRVGYVGESGQHLVNHEAANQLYTPCVIGGVVQASFTSAACIAADPAPFYSLAGQSGSITYTQSNAMMNYNALQASFRQRMSHGLEYTVNYTYSKAMTNAVGFFQVSNINGGSNYAENAYNNQAEYTPTGQDVRHGINGNLLYELPIGRGRRFGANMPIVLDELIGGWKVGMTGVAYSGFPVTLTAANNAFTDNKYQRPNQLRPMRKVNRSVTNWFGNDPSVTPCTAQGSNNGVCAYAQPANGTYGTASGGSERAPGYQDYDASISKSFPVFREQNLTFRVDASNVLNLTSLGNPNPSITSTSFGKITSVRSGPRRLQLDLKYVF